MSDNKEVAIDVKDLVIRYKTLKQVSIKQSLFSLRKSTKEEHVAVDGISFQVKQGEIMGVIGKNGSGKSTLLKAIAGIFSPDSGSINIYDNSVSLIAIGKGFDKNLTGRENIRLTGMLLGFSREEIEKEIPRIIRFADIGRFIDMPVKTYSSGMFTKLSFSINTILLTDIILIDEVLSVGDAQFKRKSRRRMKKIINSSKRTVVLVSHSMAAIKKLCDRVIWMEDGKIIMIGEAEEVVEKYLEVTLDKKPAAKEAAAATDKAAEEKKDSEAAVKTEEAEKPAETEKTEEAEKPAETDKSAEAEKPAETDKPAEAEKTAETDKASDGEEKKDAEKEEQVKK